MQVFSKVAFRKVAFLALASVAFTTAIASAAAVTIDGMPVSSVVVPDGGRNLYLWVWLLPISSFVCGAAYMVLNGQLKLDYHRGKRSLS